MFLTKAGSVMIGNHDGIDENRGGKNAVSAVMIAGEMRHATPNGICGVK
jgi:hypothetical protein